MYVVDAMVAALLASQVAVLRQSLGSQDVVLAHVLESQAVALVFVFAPALVPQDAMVASQAPILMANSLFSEMRSGFKFCGRVN